MCRKSIVFTRVNTAELIEEAFDMHPAPGKVIVQTAFSTVSSGTERANLTGDPNVSPSKVQKEVVFPRRSGYSTSGIVLSVGEGVTAVMPGDRVAMLHTTHSQYLEVEEKNLCKLDDGITFQEAAIWHIATFPLAAIRKCRLEIGESAIVMGMGILGMMAVKLLRAAGAAPVIAVDPVPQKREEALLLGADYALDPFEPEFAQKVKTITGGGVNVAIEVTGNGKALDTVLDCMAKFGRVALLGCTRNSDFTIDYYRKVHAPGITMIGAHTNARPQMESYPGMWTTMDDMKALQKLVLAGRLDFTSMVAEVHAPKNAPEVYHRLATEKTFPLVQFDWSKLV
ncbi:MAG: zinc-binding alcohol dehydrogenase [Ruminococcaceae bacterium]|nr:zinc-binding alcohol dehydrogenase [Oscillospiraceae bacterium]